MLDAFPRGGDFRALVDAPQSQPLRKFVGGELDAGVIGVPLEQLAVAWSPGASSGRCAKEWT